MNHFLLKFFALSVLLMIPSLVIAKNYTIINSGKRIEVKAYTYSISISKTEPGFTTSLNDRVILRTSDDSAVFFQRNGKTYIFDKLIGVDGSSDTLHLRYLSSASNVKGMLDFVFFSDHYSMFFHTNATNDKLGYNVSIEKDANWYGGNITSAQNWPSNMYSFEVDPFYSTSNQTSPIWYSSSGAGLLVRTMSTMGYSFNKNKQGVFSFHVKNTTNLELVITLGKTIKDSFESMAGIIGKPSQVPPKDYFANSIFNSWIEFKKDVNQEGLLKYAKEIRNYQIPCSILEIDDKWTPNYGDFEFDTKKFPEPGRMVGALQKMNFSLGLWITPFVEKKSVNYNYLSSMGFLIMEPTGNSPFIAQWWNGEAALLDLSNPGAYTWFLNQLKKLTGNYGIAGFKFDAGDAEYLNKPYKSHGGITPIQYTDLFASIAAGFKINELRVSWFTQPLGLVQRLRDKHSDWTNDNGIGAIVPHGMTEGIIGYPFFCPDMIGGGELGNFMENNSKKVDSELFIRWVEASSFMPMMQFSFAPWKLDTSALNICIKYSLMHSELGDYIYNLAMEASHSGTPIVRPLYFSSPEDSATYRISDQFMLGNKFLVAPVLKKGAVSRDIYLPGGTWIDYWNGNIIHGGITLRNYDAPLEKLPIFIHIL